LPENDRASTGFNPFTDGEIFQTYVPVSPDYVNTISGMIIVKVVFPSKHLQDEYQREAGRMQCNGTVTAFFWL